MQIALGYNEHPINDPSMLLSSLKRLTEHFLDLLKVCQLQFPKDQVPARNGILRLNCLQKRVMDVMQGSKCTKPLVTEMFHTLGEQDCQGFIFTNSDIIIPDEALQWILDHFKEYDSSCFSRADIWPGQRRSDIGFAVSPPAGADMFYVNTTWWRTNEWRFKDLPCIYAEPCWDNAFMTVMRRYGRCFFHNREPLIYHVRHEHRWSLKSREGLWQDQQWEKSGLKMIWYTYMDHIRARPVDCCGRFTGNADEESRYADKLFKEG